MATVAPLPPGSAQLQQPPQPLGGGVGATADGNAGSSQLSWEGDKMSVNFVAALPFWMADDPRL